MSLFFALARSFVPHECFFKNACNSDSGDNDDDDDNGDDDDAILFS